MSGRTDVSGARSSSTIYPSSLVGHPPLHGSGRPVSCSSPANDAHILAREETIQAYLQGDVVDWQVLEEMWAVISDMMNTINLRAMNQSAEATFRRAGLVPLASRPKTGVSCPPSSHEIVWRSCAVCTAELTVLSLRPVYGNVPYSRYRTQRCGVQSNFFRHMSRM